MSTASKSLLAYTEKHQEGEAECPPLYHPTALGLTSACSESARRLYSLSSAHLRVPTALLVGIRNTFGSVPCACVLVSPS